MQFRYYKVDEIRFKDIAVPDAECKFQLHPEYTHTLIEQGDHKYDFTISVNIAPTDDEPAPFELYVAITGHFTLCESEDKPLDVKTKEILLKKNTAAILFPFLRSVVSTVTVNANIPALLLPTFNFAEDDSPAEE